MSERRTSLGIPLPDHVQYVPGACPKAEEGAKRVRGVSMHHAQGPEDVREAARAIREAIEKETT